MKRLKSMVRGFTLVELLIVLAVIAALLSIVTPIALNAVAQAKAVQVAANFRNIRSAVETYFYTNQATALNNATTTLVSKGYLTNWPAGFDIKGGSVSFDSNATATFTITYEGGVDLDRLKSILNEVKKDGDKLTLEATIVKWW